MAQLKHGFAIGLVVALMGLCTASASDAPPREVNITSDSAPGWLPSVAQSQLAEKTAHDYLAARDGGHLEEAYRFLTGLLRSHLAFAEYDKEMREFNTKAGIVVERRIVKITWTKDPAHAPAPGIYAALDLVSRFANIDRHCGFLILYQPPSGGDFQVMREEQSFLENTSAQSIEREHSRVEVDRLWSELSSHCPNYPGVHR